MADDKTYYAWSRINYTDKDGNTRVKMPGKVVTVDNINTTEEHFDELIQSGAIRRQEWPEDLNPNNPNALSPNEHMLRKLRLERERIEAQIASAGGEMPGQEEEEVQVDEFGNPIEPPPA